MNSTAPEPAAFPAWLPDPARLYLRHVEQGIPLRVLARDEGCAASTILRRVRRIEARRDDPLVDEALERLGRAGAELPANAPSAPPATVLEKDQPAMTAPFRPCDIPADEAQLMREAQRILRRLTEPGALLVVSTEMEKSVVLRGTVRTAVLDRAVAQAFALKDWIEVAHAGRVTSYRVTQAGRAALRRILEQEEPAGGSCEDGAQPFAAQHREFGTRAGTDPEGTRRRMRANLSESPLGALARRRDRDGTPFLSAELVAAGERLREDFELAQMGPRVGQNWERFLTGGGGRGQYRPDLTQGGGGSERARERVALALRDLGPGLGDMALRCCCFLEGLEAAEKRLGWSARSGKIVLRIALQRLKQHYDETYGGASPLIG
ncbi:helix-turn-helix domain-containing protein [Thioclava sp. BHET1]|nr:helix-turn-helix domain-containing protein [Thioclava sp. BHET1]